MHGPFGKEASQGEIEVGDIVQLSFDGVTFGHNLIVVDTSYGIKVAAHSFDVYGKGLMAYNFNRARFVHVEGVRMWE